MYSKILQPEVWAQWVRNKVDAFEDGNVTNCQDFMNSAVIKYNKISSTPDRFKGSVHTVQEDIIALVAAKVKVRSEHNDNKRKRETDDYDDKSSKKLGKSVPKFMNHFFNLPKESSTKSMIQKNSMVKHIILMMHLRTVIE